MSSAGDVAADLAAAPTRCPPRSLHSFDNVENLTLTGAPAIDGTGKASVIIGIGTENLLSGFCRH